MTWFLLDYNKIVGFTCNLCWHNSTSSLTWWSILFLDVLTLKLRIIIIIIIIILATNYPKVILLTARTSKNLVVFALETNVLAVETKVEVSKK